MPVFDKTPAAANTLAAPPSKIGNWTVNDIRKSDILVFRENRSEYVDTVVAPNGFQVGLLDEAFLTDLLVTGHITGSGVIYSELGFSGSLQTLVDGTDYLRAGTGISITNNDNGSITIANTGSGSPGTTYTAGSALTLNSTQFNVETDGTTISIDSNNDLSVQKVPNSLAAGNGLVATTYDGSAARTLTVKAVSGSPITVSSSGVGMTISSMNAVSLSGTDEVLVQKGSTIAKTTIQDILNLVPSSGGGSNPTGAAYLVAQSSSELSNERVLQGGSGVTVTDDSGLGTMTVSIALENNGGLEFVNGRLAVNVADFIGFGLQENSGQIVLNTSVLAGVGLTANNNGALDVNFGNSATEVAKGSNTISVNAGDGLSLGGTATIGNTASDINLEIRTADIKGIGTSVANNNLDLYLKGRNGIIISTGSIDGNGIPIIIDAAGVSGGGGGGASGNIGEPEDGTYTDGLFTDFATDTRVGVAVDRFNEVLKYLVPKSSPRISTINSTAVGGVTGNLSFGQSNVIANFENVAANDDLPAKDANDVYAIETSSNGNIRLGIFAQAVDIVGVLGSNVAANNTSNGDVNYSANSFGKGNEGNLILELNGIDVHTINLADNSIGSGAAGNGTGEELSSVGNGFIELSSATSGKYSSGEIYDVEKHRTGKYKIAAASIRKGYNFCRIKHTIGTTTLTTNYIQWIYDPVSENGQIAFASESLSSITMTGTKYLSGVNYHTGGTATYAVNVNNFYTNVYGTTPFVIDSNTIATENVTPTSIDTGNGEDESKSISISESVTIDATSIYNTGISSSISISHPTKNDVSNGANATIAGILQYNIAESSAEILKTTENFNGETNRLEANNFVAQSDVGSNAYNSQTSLVTNSGLQVWNQRLVAPTQTTNGGDFSSIANGPAGNPDYSGLTTGDKVYYRKFENNTGGSKSNFTFTISGVGTIIANTETLDTNKFMMFAKLPGPNNNTTGWLDIALPFVTDQYNDNDGCLVEAFDSSLDSTILATFGTKFVENGEHLVIKIVANAGWTGHIDELRITWR